MPTAPPPETRELPGAQVAVVGRYEERGGPPPRQLIRAQSKETFSVIYSEANAAGVVDVLSVLKALRERVKTLPRGADSRSTSPDPGSNPRSPEADDSAGNDEEAAAEGEGGEQAAGEEHEGFKLALVTVPPAPIVRYPRRREK